MYDQRTEIWNSTWRSLYETFYQELLSERLVLRWKRFDDFSKLLIAFTASGSAISGWTLWNKDEYKFIWLIFAGAGAILSIISKTLDVSIRINDWSDSRSIYSLLRIKYQILFDEMKFKPDFLIDETIEKLNNLKLEYAEVYKKNTVDAFLTNRLKYSVQNELNNNLSQYN